MTFFPSFLVAFAKCGLSPQAVDGSCRRIFGYAALAVCIAAGLLPTSAIASEENAEVPTHLKLCWHDGAPYSSPSLPDGGLHADFVRTVMEEAGFAAEMSFMPWARCKALAKKHHQDLLFAMWNNVDIHRANFDFLNATDIQYTSFVTLEDSPLQSGRLEDLNDVGLALHLDGGYDTRITNHPGFRFSYVSGDKDKLRMLIRGRVDLTLGDPVRFQTILRDPAFGESASLKVLLPHVGIQRTSPAISKTHPHKLEIIDRYNAAYSRLCQSGTLKHIIQKHGFDYQPPDCPQ